MVTPGPRTCDRWAVAAVAVAFMPLVAGCSPDTAAPKKDGAEPPGVVRLAPVLRLPANGPFSVPLSFTNGSDQPFVYVITGGEILGLRYALYRDGKDVPGDAPTVGPGLNPVYTPKTLKPGESLRFSFKLERHMKLKAGEYELQIDYGKHRSAIDDKYNTTPATFTLNYTLIVE